MNRAEIAFTQLLFDGTAAKLKPCPVYISAAAVQIRHPDHGRRYFSQEKEVSPNRFPSQRGEKLAPFRSFVLKRPGGSCHPVSMVKPGRRNRKRCGVIKL